MSTPAQAPRPLLAVAVVVDAAQDNVAVVKDDVAAGTLLTWPGYAPYPGDDGARDLQPMLAAASGEPVKAELSGHREFLIWSEESVSL